MSEETKIGINMGEAEIPTGYPDPTPPGVHEMTIGGVELKQTAAESYYLSVKFVTSGSEFTESFFLNSKVSLGRLKELLLGCDVAEAAINAAQNTDELIKLLNGKQTRLIVGQNIKLFSDGGSKIYACLPYSRFAESITIPKEKSALRFNPNAHVKRKVVSHSDQAKSGAVTNAGVKDDLPF